MVNRFRAARWAAAAGGGALAYLGANLIRVWLTSRLDQARPVEAIVVLGAAQHGGRPSPVLKARLDHAFSLWQRRLSDVVVVTGGRTSRDRFSEAGVSAAYLSGLGLPGSHVLREMEGTNSWQSLAAAAAMLAARDRSRVLLVSDPFHSERISLMAGELGLEPYVSPTRSSPMPGPVRAAHFAKEAGEVSIGRLVGFRRLVDMAERVPGLAPAAKVASARSGVV